MKLDTERRRATPEGVTLHLRVAGPPARCLAWLVDLVIITAVQIVLGIGLALLGGLGEGVYLIVLFALSWFYFAGFELWKDGTTPGKKLFNLQVVNDDGTPIDPVSSIVRNFLRVADFLPVAFGAGLVSMSLHRDFKRLGDLAAGTLVVYRDRDDLGEAVPEAPPRVPPVALDREEQRAIVDFAERHHLWSSERASELAEASGPLVAARGDEAVRHLLEMANWLLGRQMPEARADREMPTPIVEEAVA